MNLSKLKSDYNNNKIPKADYIEEMFKIHKYLYDYSEFIKNTGIAKIEITNGKVVMTTRDEIKILCEKNDRRIVPIEMLNFNSYEEDEAKIALSLVEKGFQIFDIGANFGWYSLLFAKYVKMATIHAFEPVKKTFNFLNSNIKLNNAKNIKTYNFGFSDKKGQRVLYVRGGESGIASMANLKDDKNAKKIICKMVPLDDFVKSNKTRIDFIKCDVEGSELLVYKGAKEAITKNKPIVFSEMLRKWSARFNYHPNEIIDLFSSWGYQCFTTKNGSLKKFAKMDENTKETNFLFLHTINHKSKIKEFSQNPRSK